MADRQVDGPLKVTPLKERHLAAGGRLVPFAGWEMPVQYSGLIQEHQAVRSTVGIFDVSHMGELVISGKDAQSFLQWVTCNDVSRLKPGSAQYSAVLNPQGGVIDDIIVYCIHVENFLLCVNASNTDTVERWLSEKLEEKMFDAELSNRSSHYGQLALQGPEACAVLARDPELCAVTELDYFSFDSLKWNGFKVIVARTGYTGEDGFEIFIDWAGTPELWDYLVNTCGVIPCGLGARDTLRLEAGYPLHGHELSEEVSAIESGLSWIVKLQKGDFVGAAAIKCQREQGVVGFVVNDAGIARAGDMVLSEDGKTIGEVTSGTKTPTVGRSLGIARVEKEYAMEGQSLTLRVRQRELNGEIRKLPFYTAVKRKKVA
jgi:aminomethyltransferase